MDSYVLIIVAAYGTHIFKNAIKDNFGAKLNQIISFKSIIYSISILLEKSILIMSYCTYNTIYGYDVGNNVGIVCRSLGRGLTYRFEYLTVSSFEP